MDVVFVSFPSQIATYESLLNKNLLAERQGAGIAGEKRPGMNPGRLWDQSKEHPLRQ
jgi:hypothetical protein